MRRKERDRIKPAQIQDCRYFKPIPELLERLHEQATERDRAGNREFFCDQYVSRPGWAPPGNRLWAEPTLLGCEGDSVQLQYCGTASLFRHE